MTLNQQYWQERYTSNEIGWDLGHISQPLKEYIDQIDDKSAHVLIPGAGNAHEGIYMIQNGFNNVHILDIAASPLEFIQLHMPEIGKNSLVHQDFFKHQGNYDLILEQTFFCALEPRLRENYVKKTYELLNSNGVLAGVLFNFKSERSTPPFGGTLLEYKELFDPYFHIKIMEPCYNSEESRKNKELFIIMIKKNNGN